jgi:hypothetical protein
MLRRLLYIVCAVVTFQLSWNVITSYCMHETGQAANHFGHHQHNPSYDELSSAAKDGSHVAKKLIAHDAHCGTYAHLTLAMPDHFDTLSVPNSTERVVDCAISSPASVFLTPPERPQWTGRA